MVTPRSLFSRARKPYVGTDLFTKSQDLPQKPLQTRVTESVSTGSNFHGVFHRQGAERTAEIAWHATNGVHASETRHDGVLEIVDADVEDGWRRFWRSLTLMLAMTDANDGYC